MRLLDIILHISKLESMCKLLITAIGDELSLKYYQFISTYVEEIFV